MKVMMDRIFKCFLLLVLMLPIGMLFHENIWLRAMAVIYIFGLWWLVRKPSKDEG